MKTIYLAGGCFWGVEHFFAGANGIISTEAGYANGKTSNPSYEDVRYMASGHAETVKVIYDENILSLSLIISKFMSVIDPYSINKQGEDVGISYRSGIYYTDSSDLNCILNEIEKYNVDGKKCAVEVLPLSNFYPAEEYHQKYLEKNPGGYCHIKLRFEDK